MRKKTVFALVIHSKFNLESYDYNTIPLSESIIKISDKSLPIPRSTIIEFKLLTKMSPFTT